MNKFTGTEMFELDFLLSPDLLQTMVINSAPVDVLVEIAACSRHTCSQVESCAEPIYLECVNISAKPEIEVGDRGDIVTLTPRMKESPVVLSLLRPAAVYVSNALAEDYEIPGRYFAASYDTVYCEALRGKPGRRKLVWDEVKSLIHPDVKEFQLTGPFAKPVPPVKKVLGQLSHVQCVGFHNCHLAPSNTVQDELHRWRTESNFKLKKSVTSIQTKKPLPLIRSKTISLFRSMRVSFRSRFQTREK